MSDLQSPPSAQTLSERIEALCTEIAPIAEDFEAADSLLKTNSHIRAMRHSRSYLTLNPTTPSTPHIAAAKESYLTALPILEETIPRIESCHERFTAFASVCEGLLEEYLDERSVELRSEVFRHECRVVYLGLLGLMGMIASLEEGAVETLEYYTVCREQAGSEEIGSVEWAEEVSPVRSLRSAGRESEENGGLEVED